MPLAGSHWLDLAVGRRRYNEAHWLQASEVYRGDSYDHGWLAEDRARILAQTGDTEGALDEIERLLAGPSGLSVHMLRLDPLWDPLRSSRRFQAILAEGRSHSAVMARSQHLRIRYQAFHVLVVIISQGVHNYRALASIATDRERAGMI